MSECSSRTGCGRLSRRDVQAAESGWRCGRGSFGWLGPRAIVGNTCWTPDRIAVLFSSGESVRSASPRPIIATVAPAAAVKLREEVSN